MLWALDYYHATSHGQLLVHVAINVVLKILSKSLLHTEKLNSQGFIYGREGGGGHCPPPPGNLATAFVCILLPCNNT